LTAVILPTVLFAALGAAQVAMMVATRQSTQSIADSAALMAAQQLEFDADGARARAEAWAKGQLAAAGAQSFEVASSLLGNREVEVDITAATPSLFGAEAPKGGFATTVRSIAQSVNAAPLCVVVSAPQTGDMLQLSGGSRLQSSCLVYADGDIQVSGAAQLNAPLTETSGSATGTIAPAALTQAVPIPDPFAGLNVEFPWNCPTQLPDLVISSNVTLPAGAPFCANIVVDSGYTVTLAPGEHYLYFNLTLQPGAVLTGSDVVLDFGPTSAVSFAEGASVALGGRRSGPLAGFVIITSRHATSPFTIQTDAVSEATGVVYSPAAPLVLQGSSTAAAASDWTVVVARSLSMTGSPTLQLNAQYASSSVPVPSGVGPMPTTARLAD
jgi:hypothetical protein